MLRSITSSQFRYTDSQPMSNSVSVLSLMNELHTLAERRCLESIQRFGIKNRQVLGVTVPKLRALGKRLGKNHQLAAELWSQGFLETRILASLIDEPAQVTPAQMESWARDLESWADCDAVCGNLFDRTPHAVGKAIEWTDRPEEYIKRAGFVLMASLAIHDKMAEDKVFLTFLPYLVHGSEDPRNFVRKAVNWALRQVGKRNTQLKAAALETAATIAAQKHASARWIAADAIRELKRVVPKNIPNKA